MITSENYFAHEGVSQSQLRDLARSPLHYYAKHIAKTVPSETTAAMRFGSAVHMAVLEPHLFATTYCTKDWDARTKAGKAQSDAVEAAGFIVLPLDEANAIADIVVALREHPLASRILSARTHTEEPIMWADGLTGVVCKAKPDACVELGGRRSLVDLKTATDADPESFSRSIATYGYALQGAHYLNGWRAAMGDVDSFTFIVVEKSAPYAVAVYELDAEAIEVGAAKRARLLDLLATCRAENRWPGYASQSIGLPRWAVGGDR